MQETVSLIWDSPEAGLPRALIRPLRIDATWQKPTKTQNSSFSITAQPFENRCDLTKTHKNTKNVFFKIMPRPLKIDVTCKKSMKHVDFPYFSTLETIGFPFVFTRSYQILQKKTGFFSLVVKGILRYKNVLCFFSKLFIS